jgi:hypothetical protein
MPCAGRRAVCCSSPGTALNALKRRCAVAPMPSCWTSKTACRRMPRPRRVGPACGLGELRAAGVPLVLRINAGEQGGDDLVALAPLLAGAAVMVSKAESAAALSHIGARLPGSAILPLIESAAGLAALSEIASAPLVLRLAVGHLDFMADTGLQCGDDESELAPLRFALAMATRVQRLAPAVDGVTVAIDDDERLRRDTQRALRFGFGAKLCIHPRQVPVVHEAPGTQRRATSLGKARTGRGRIGRRCSRATGRSDGGCTGSGSGSAPARTGALKLCRARGFSLYDLARSSRANPRQAVLTASAQGVGRSSRQVRPKGQRYGCARAPPPTLCRGRKRPRAGHSPG